jgi:hypothetical protein
MVIDSSDILALLIDLVIEIDSFLEMMVKLKIFLYNTSAIFVTLLQI